MCGGGGGISKGKNMHEDFLCDPAHTHFYAPLVTLHRHKLNRKTSAYGKLEDNKMSTPGYLKIKKRQWHMGGTQANKDPEILPLWERRFALKPTYAPTVGGQVYAALSKGLAGQVLLGGGGGGAATCSRCANALPPVNLPPVGIQED